MDRCTVVPGVLAAGLLSFAATLAPPPTDPMLASLEAELGRAMAGLAEKAERPPWFLGYQVWDRTSERLAASHGALLADDVERQHFLHVHTRAASHDLDNTHRFQDDHGAIR